MILFGFAHVVIPKGKKIVFLSGQLAWDKDFQGVGVNDLAKQTNMVYQNIQQALNEIGATWVSHHFKQCSFSTHREKNTNHQWFYHLCR